MFADIVKIVSVFIKTIFKDSRKVKKIMYQKSVYISISYYSKICWVPMKKYWSQQNSRGVSHDSYVFWIFSR